jgi:uncharacterized lipoprotein YddW (UPF0748 family)
LIPAAPAGGAWKADAVATEGDPARGGGPAPGGDPLPADVRAIWVVRESLGADLAPERIPQAAARMGANTLFVQVSGRGDAWHASELLPRAEELSPDAGDPFARLCEEALALDLSVHAWVNVGLVWSAPDPPVSGDHIIHRHPEWIMRLPDGQTMTALSRETMDEWQVEGCFAELANPGYRRAVGSIVRELLERYPIDGVHLDYIRRPAVDTGYDGATAEAFRAVSGMDPPRPASTNGAPWSDYRDAPDDPALSAWNRFRRDAVTQAVREVRYVVDAASAERGRRFALTAAVIPDPERARRRFAQCWPEWLSAGLVDCVVPMCYRAGWRSAEAELSAALATSPADRVIAGVACFQQPMGEAGFTLRRMLDRPIRGVCLFSWGVLEERGFRDERLIRRAWMPFRATQAASSIRPVDGWSNTTRSLAEGAGESR